MKYMVTLHFGDGTYHRIEIEDADSPEDACEHAKRWVLDNWFFEAEEVQE